MNRATLYTSANILLLYTISFLGQATPITVAGTLDKSFNPSGLIIQANGSSSKITGLGYAGSLIIDLGARDYAFSVDSFNFADQGDRILLGGRTDTGPNPRNFALAVLHGNTRFPPLPVSQLNVAALPFIVMATA